MVMNRYELMKINNMGNIKFIWGKDEWGGE